MTNFMHKILVRLLQSSTCTCFEQYLAHPQEVKLFFLNLCTGRSLTESDDTRCCINTIWPPEDEQDIARNMYM
jgi:hypothetical protein